MESLQVGQTIHSFRVTSVEAIPEIRSMLIQAEHIPSGARVVQIQAPDSENLFCISLRTEPQDDTGVAHILEHLVLFGSERFPVKDPFMAMLRRSMHTFLNAFTGADFTAYPAASLVPKDFYNLLNVYFDAVFFPLLSQEGFRQEGWRLEFEERGNVQSPLCFKGVVYNEMKGALADPDSRLWLYLTAHLFPDLTYRVSSGGLPEAIVDLSWEQLKQFHSQAYHPSRSILFFYGDIPLEQHLAFLSPLLAPFQERLSLQPPIPAQKRFQQPQRRIERFPSARPVPAQFALAWLTAPCTDLQELLTLEILLLLLMGTDASPLKRGLLESDLCQDVEASLSSEMSEMPFVLNFRGIDAVDAEATAIKLEQKTLQLLEEIASEGFSEAEICGALDQIELQKLEICGDDGSYGLSLYFRLVLPMQHGANPLEVLQIREAFKRVRETLKDPRALSRVIEKWFLNQQHRLALLMLPDAAMAEEEAQAEQQHLRTIEQRLTEGDRQAIVKQTETLDALQQKDEDYSCLPSLHIEDIPIEVPNFALSQEQTSQGAIFRHETCTQGLVYVDLVLPFVIPEVDLLPALFAGTQLITEIGAAGKSYAEMLQDQLAFTGGISVGWSLFPQAHDGSCWRPGLRLRGKALERHAHHLIELMQQIRYTADWSDTDRIAELIEQNWSYLETQLVSLAPRIASSLAAAQVSSASALDAHAMGPSYLRWIDNAYRQAGDSATLREQLATLSQHMALGPAEVIITAEAAGHELLSAGELAQLMHAKAQTDCGCAAKLHLWPKPALPIVADGRVAFINQALAAVPFTDPRSPLLALAGEIMQHKILHPEIREQGGAYGSRAALQPQSGIFTMSSYRDPNINSTIMSMRRALQFAAKGDFDDQDLLEAQLATLQRIQVIPSPGARGYRAWSWMRQGMTHDVRLQWKQRVLQATTHHIAKAAEEVLLPEASNIAPVIVAGAEVLKREGYHTATPLSMCLDFHQSIEL